VREEARENIERVLDPVSQFIDITAHLALKELGQFVWLGEGLSRWEFAGVDGKDDLGEGEEVTAAVPAPFRKGGEDVEGADVHADIPDEGCSYAIDGLEAF
jgi:hypothetical protein